MIRSTRADGAVPKMPLARYFFFVGAALLALLFVADAYLPKLPAADSTTTVADVPTIRIQSDRKWPERIVFDTTMPAASVAQSAAAVPAGAPAKVAQAAAKPTDVSAKVREAFAQLQPPDSPKLQPSVSKTPAAAVPQKHRMAKKHTAPPMVLVAQQQQPRPFGFFGNNW
jgi:hypothetical protein